MLTEARSNFKKKIKNTSLPGSLDEDTFTAEFVVNVSNCLKRVHSGPYRKKIGLK